MTIQHTPFFAAYRKAFSRPGHPVRLNETQVQGMIALLGFIEADAGMADIRHAAYLLATVKHECADQWQPIREYGNHTYFRRYEPNTRVGKSLGNRYHGDGALYKGRGYVQITGRANYAKFGIEDSPDEALQPDVAYRIASEGMRRGLFTGKKLSDYIHDGGCDYRGARRIINGTDRAELIAGYAIALEEVLRASVVSP